MRNLLVTLEEDILSFLDRFDGFLSSDEDVKSFGLEFGKDQDYVKTAYGHWFEHKIFLLVCFWKFKALISFRLYREILKDVLNTGD